MTDRTIVRCTSCNGVYAAEKHEGTYLIPTPSGTCSCGGTEFTTSLNKRV